MPNPFIKAILFLIQVAFSLYIAAMALRLVLQIAQANVRNPITQFIIRITNPCIRPLQRFIPRWKDVDWAIVVVLVLLQLIELFLIGWLSTRHIPNFWGLLLWTCGDLGQLLTNIYSYAILIRVILSWIMPIYGSPLMEVVYVITEPMLSYFRRWLPLIGGIDLSPLFAIIILQLFSILLFTPLIQIGQTYTF
ncbi:MAG: YggT family protein [Gammaproteobacteria bacterium]